MTMQHREWRSVGREVPYYASFEIIREVSDIARTVRFHKPEDAATARFERLEPATVPFVKYSSPYERIDIEELLDPRIAAALVRPPVAQRKIDATAPVESMQPAPSASIECDLGDLASEPRDADAGDTSELFASDLIPIDELGDLRTSVLQNEGLNELDESNEPLPGETLPPASEPLPGETLPASGTFDPDHTAPMTIEDHESCANNPIGDPTSELAARSIVLARTRAAARVAHHRPTAGGPMADESCANNPIGDPTSELPARSIVLARTRAAARVAHHRPTAGGPMADDPRATTEMLASRNLVAGPRAATQLIGDRTRGVSAGFVVMAVVLLAGAFALGLGIPFLVTS
jgi:hypothetical protein